MIVICDDPITHAKDDTVHCVIEWAVAFISQIEGDVKERTLMFD